MSQQEIVNERHRQERDAASRIRDRHGDPQQRHSATKTKQTASIISLSKLKSYMPQNHLTPELFPCLARSSISKPIAHMASSVPFYRKRGDLPDSSTYLGGNHENLARAKPIGSSPHLDTIDRSVERKTPTQGTSDGYNQQQATATAALVNQVVTVAQQELRDQLKQQRNSITDSRDSSSDRSEATNCSKTVKGAESREVEQHNQSLSSREQRERKKIGFPNVRGTREDKGDEREQRSICGSSSIAGYKSRNNMTPSSLLLLHNHSFGEQQYRNSAGYISSDHQHNQQEKTKDISIEQSASASENCTRGSVINSAANKLSDNQPHRANYIESSQSSSLMLPQINQFKALDNAGNSSTDNSSGFNNLIGISASTTASNSGSHTNLNGTSRSNLVDSSDYLSSHNSDRSQDQQRDGLASNISNLQQCYPQNLPTTCSRKVTTSTPQFVQYSAQNNRQSLDSYQTSFPATMLEQQIKFENGIIGRGIFEENNSISINQNNILTGESNNDTISTTRDLAQHRAMTSINQYYNNHYNILMPTPSSKSSSPASSTSTPSPKTNAMHPNASQISSQMVSTGVPNSSASQQLHLDHINHNYIGNTVASDGMSHQQHQVNQHYSYNPHSTGTQNHHLAISNQEQHAYAHQHQQQPLQHQHHLQQPQHHHQQQQQQHQQHQSQQSIYQHLANNGATMNVNQIYGNSGAGTHYQGHIQNNTVGHQPGHLMSSAHQSHLNTAAAARAAAAAVVSQTLKTVANQQSHQHNYTGDIANGFGATTGGFMNMNTQHHQQFHSMNSLNHHQHHLSNQNSVVQQQQNHQQQQIVSMHHPSSVTTRKYQCKMCPQVFMSRAEMKYHNQNHMREAKPYKCLQCPKAFANSSYLSQHMRIHQGVKPYTCDICSRKFTQLSHLQQHKRTHTGDKPYKCNYMNCTKQFSQLSNLQSHSRCHQLDKPYKCNSCYKCFHDEQSLLEHIPRHLESKHLKKNLCIFCGSSYQQERGLVKHFQQYHTDKTPTLVAAAIAAGTTGNTNLIASLVSSKTSNAFVVPTNGGIGGSTNGGSSSSSTSSSSSVSSSGSLNLHNNLSAVVHGAPTGE